MKDIKALEIARSKALANPDKYFSQIDKRIDDSFSNCFLFEIGNEDVIMRTIQKNPEANYLIYDDPGVGEILKIVNKEYNYNISFCGNDEVKEDEIFDKIESEAKVDMIIMNPPYCKNFNQNIFAKALQHLTDDGDFIMASHIALD